MFEAKDVLARVQKMGDLFEPVQKLKQKLPELAGLGEAAEKEKEEEKGISIAAQAETRPQNHKPGSSKKKLPKEKPTAGKRRKL